MDILEHQHMFIFHDDLRRDLSLNDAIEDGWSILISQACMEDALPPLVRFPHCKALLDLLQDRLKRLI